MLAPATVILLLATPFTLNNVSAQQAASVCTPLDDSGTFPGGNEYMCVDWSVGSAAMEDAEGDYLTRTGKLGFISGAFS